MTITGALSDVLLLDVLQVLSITSRDGMLVVEQGGQRVELMFAKGRLVTARLEPPRYHLANHLMKNGWIEFETLHEALKRQEHAAERRLVGEILIEMGALTQDQLIDGLQHHVREVLCEILSWTRGAFRFDTAPPETVRDFERLGVGFDGDDLRRLAAETSEDRESSQPRDPSTGFIRPLEEASWLAKPRLALLVTDDLLVRHGLELRLRSRAFALVAASGVQQVGEILLASGDQEPALVIDLDMVGRERTVALQTFHTLRKLHEQWPNVRVVTYGRTVPEAFFQHMLRCPVAFHLPRASARAEEDIELIRDFIEVLARLVTQDGGLLASLRSPEPLLGVFE